MQHSKHTGFNLKRKITASLLSLAILGTGTLPLVSTVVAAAAEDDGSVGANASVIAVGNTDENKGVFWANAKYYDYLTDNEVSGGWLTGLTQSGTGHCGSDDDWYPFKKFNSFISGIASGSNWSKPLYFGNFYNDNDGPYATSDHNGPYTSAKDGLTNFRHSPNNSQKGVVGHDSKKKESGVETTGIDEEHQSYQGLVDSTLKNGNLTVGGGTVAPYFQANDTYVKEFQSSFPFRQEVHSDYTKYIFQSSTGSNNENAADNVYFDWNGTTPTAVNYSYGTNHAVKDGKRYFMWKENSGYGIYPFNKVGEEKSGQTNGYLYISVRNSEVHWDLGMNKDPYVYWNDNRVSWPGTKMEWVRDEDGGDNKVYKIKIPDGLKNTGFVVNNGNGGGSNQTVDGSYDLLKWGCATVKGSGQGEKHNLEGWPTAESGAGINEYTYNTEKLDHGFGIHLTVPFRVPKGGVAADGTKITFDFAGDDDLWMFITDNTTKKSQLVLDMGGNHKKSVGQVDFKNKQSTVNAYNGQKDSAKSFEFDYSHTYTMDVFYMERGMIESNCDMSFTMTPLGNNVIVTEKINTTDVNPGLVNDVTALSDFTFTPSEGSADWTNGLSYTTGEVEYNKLYVQIDESKLGTWKNPKCSFEGIYSSAAKDMTYDSAKSAYVLDIPYGSRTVTINTDGGSVTGTYQDLMGGALCITKDDDDNVVIESMEDVPADAGFNLFENTENHSKSGKTSVDLGSSQSFMVPNFYHINDSLNVVQTRKNSVLKYTTDYTFNNNTNGQNIGSGSYGTDKPTVTSASGYLSNNGTGSGDPFEFAEIQADFVNTPDVADVKISKETVDFLGKRLAKGDLGQSDSFPITVKIDFGGSGYYDFDYTVKNGNDTSEGTANAGKLNIRDGDEITIPNVPVGSTVTVAETLTDNFDKNEFKDSATFTVTKNGGSTAITNYRKPPEGTATVQVDKTIALQGNENVDIRLDGSYKFQLLYTDGEMGVRDAVIDEIVLRNPDSDFDSKLFKELKFTTDSDKYTAENIKNGIFYVNPSSFSSATDCQTFYFTVREVLTEEQQKVIDDIDPEYPEVNIYYDKANNILTTDEPVPDASVMPASADFVNPYKSASLQITKTVKRSNESEELDDQDKNTMFSVKVDFTFNGNTFPNGVPLYYYYSDDTAMRNLADTNGYIELNHERTAYFDGLPFGTKVKITEDKTKGDVDIVKEYVETYNNQEIEFLEQYGTVPVEMEVINTRQAPGSQTIKVKKVLENADVAKKADVTMENANFTFNLTEITQNGTVVKELGSKVADKNGDVTFDAIKFEHAGTRYFKVSEVPGNNFDITYDNTDILVSIEAEKSASGSGLTAKEPKYYKGSWDTPADQPTFTNTYLTGEVTFNKTVIDKDANAVDEDATEFPATIKIQYPVDDEPKVQTFVLKDYDNSDAGAEPVVTTVTDGNITIKHNHTYVIGDLPLATQVEITETGSKGYLTYYAESQYMQALAFIGDAAGGSQFISDGTAGTPSDGAVPNHVTVFNQKVELPVNIAAKKNAEGFELEDKGFAFTLEGEGVDQTKSNDAQGNVKFDTITFEVRSDDKATGNNTIVIKPDQFTDDKYTAEYTIEEKAGSNAFLTYDGTEYKATVTVTRTPRSNVEGLYTYAAAVDYGNATNTPPTFTNSWKKAPARIIKKVLDSDGADITSTCTETFKINLTYKYPKGYKGSEDYPEFVELNKGNNFTATVSELPYGTEVRFVEDEYNAHGMTPTYEPADKSVTVGDNTAEIKVTNKRQAPGATSFPVKFTKQFKYGTLEGNDFEFKITDGDPITDKTAKNDKNGVVDFGTVHVKYVKTAKPAEGTTIYLTDDDFDATGVATLTFTAKETDAHEANVFYDQEPVTFVQKIKKTVTAAQTTLSLDNSYYEKGNETNLTEGRFVNEYKGDIKISKTIENVSEAQKNKTFTADVEIKLVGADGKLSDKFEKIPYSYTYTDEGSARPVTTDPTTVLELKHGRVFTLSGIPMGSVIKVTERADDKYTPSYNTTGAKVGETAEIIVTNTLNTPGQAKLDVYKTFSENALTAGVNMESKNNKFSFTMTGDSENAVLKDYSSTVVLSSYEDGLLVGKGTFDKITFPSNYAYGSGTEVKFHVVENAQIEGNDGNIIYDKSEYDVVYTVSLGEEGIRISDPVITKGNAPAETVTFQNDYPVGKVQILKSVKDFDGTDLEAFKAERFPIKITITTPDGNVTEDTTKTISAADSLDPEKVLTIDKLPYGTTVKVEETDAKGMTSSVDKPEVTVDENTPAQTVTVTNTRTKLTPAKAAPYVNKTVKGSDISLYNEKFDFELSGNGVTPLTAKNNAQGKVQFGDINFRLKKAASDKTEGNTIVIDRSAFANSKTIPFTFTVKETTADTDDIKTDKTEKTVTIKVTLDDSAIDEVKLTAAFDDTAVPTFTNEKYGRVKVTKKVLDINNTEIKPDVNFGFELYNGNTKVDSFTINVSKTDTESYTSAYFPVDTVLTVKETNPNGFNCTKDVQTITVLDEAQNEIPVVNFDNKRPQPGEVSKEFSVNKVAQGYKLSSGDFSFTAKGPNGFDETVANDVNGSANFSKITFKYTTGEEQNTATTIYLRDKDFKDGPAKFKYTITENDGGNNDIIYDLNTVVEAVITVEMNKVSESEIDLVASLAYTGGNNTFTNPVRTGSAKIIKKDQEDNPVDGVEFTLYKVSSDNLSRQQVLEDGVVQGRATTSGGEAVFENLDLYVDGNQTLSDPEYQWYCFAETDPGDSHNLNSELKFFRIPTEGVYDVEYTYMNGKITSPISGGEGMFTFKLVGSILLALASAMLAGYVFFVKKSDKKSARYSVKK